MHLDAILPDEELTGGLEPRLGRAHLRTLTVIGFPSQTWPGLLDDLNRLAFPYRWSTRTICLDKTDASRVLVRIRWQWFAKRKSIIAILKEVMTNEASVLLDSDAANKAQDADVALQELGSNLVGEAYVTATVTVWDEDFRVADERLRLVEKTIQGRDFDKPARLTINLPAPTHRDLVAYAAALAGETGQAAIEPAKLIGPMLARFMATDRAFAKLRRTISVSDKPA